MLVGMPTRDSTDARIGADSLKMERPDGALLDLTRPCHCRTSRRSRIQAYPEPYRVRRLGPCARPDLGPRVCLLTCEGYPNAFDQRG